MKKITEGAVQTAKINVSNEHDETRQYDLTANVQYSVKDDVFGANSTGQISNGVVNAEGVTRATFAQSRNLNVNYMTDNAEQQQAILAAVQDFCTEAIAFAKTVTLSASVTTENA